MRLTTMSTTETAEAPPKKKKGKKKLLIIVVGVLVLAGGIGGYLTFGTSKKPAAPKAGAVVPLAAITVNLSDGHFLKVSIALQMTAAAGTETPEGSKALDLLISQFSNKSVAELSSNDAREEAKKKLAEHVGEAYEGHVMEVYLTEFVMQ
jgi:flagellar FliL protein